MGQYPAAESWVADLHPPTVDFPVILGPGGYRVAALGDYELGNSHPYQNVEDGYTTAHFIAAAPTMFKVLKAIYDTRILN